MTNHQEEEMKSVLCKHCDVSYEATHENFYTCRGKLKLDICKDCKKERSRQNEKNRKPRKQRYRDRREYMREYQRKYRLKKQLVEQKALEGSKVN